MRENDKEKKVKHEMEEIETINIELEHSVAKLLSENERVHKEIKHLKKIYKDQFDSIKKTRALSKEHDDSLIAQLNSKSMENVDLKRQIQDKGIVEQAKAKQLLDNALNITCKHAKQIQELLVYVRETCPNDYTLSEKLITVTPMNKVKKGLKCSNSTCRSRLTGNKRNDRILQTPSSNIKNKVEVQCRRIAVIMEYLVDCDSIVCSDIEKGFLSLKGRGRGNGVKEKSSLSSDVASKNKDCVNNSVAPSIIVDYGNTQKDLNDDHMAMEVQSPLVDQTVGKNKSIGQRTAKQKGQRTAKQKVSAPKTSLAANARRNNEKALNILLSAIPDRHLLSFHDAVDARSLWKAIKARFGGNEASKKMQKNLLKQQFETFTIGSREELDSAYERFQHILSMLELHDATVSIEDANLKFLRSLPSVWHVVATMIRGQPGLDELDFDDLYNNLKVYEHELKGVSNSNSQNIAFLSTEVKGSTLKQSTAEPTNIPKGYTQAASSKVPTAPNYASHSDEIICSFFSQQASMPTTHDDEDLLQIDEDAMEEIDIRWQVAMITARIRKFMRKTGRPIDLKPKNGITFDKSKIECFNCQKLGHFARECRFAKYQENRANGRQEKKTVAIEDSNSKALVATDNNEDIDWTKEFDAEPVTYAMMALTGVEQDDWSMEFDAEHVHFGQDGLGDFDWSNKDDDTPVSLALMATNSEVKRTVAVNNDDKNLAFLTTTSPSSTNSINTANTGVSTGNSKVNTASAETSTASFSDATAYAFLSSQPQGSQLVHEDLEQIHDDDLEEMDLKWNMALLSMRARKFYQRTGRKDMFIDGIARECRVQEAKTTENWTTKKLSKSSRMKMRPIEPKKARENTDAPIIEDWVSDDEEEVVSIPKKEKKANYSNLSKCFKHMVPRAVLMRTGLKTVKNAKPLSTAKSVNTVRPSNSQLNEKGFVDSGCSRHMSGNKSSPSDLHRIDGRFFMEVFFLRTKDETSEILKNFIKEIENLVDKKSSVQTRRDDNSYSELGSLSSHLLRNEDSSDLLSHAFFACSSLSQEEPKIFLTLLVNPAWMRPMQEELLQFKNFKEMSFHGELTFFLGLQVNRTEEGIFISQDKYVHEILKKFNYTDVKSASTPTDLERPLVKDADANDVDEHLS
ncbi:ribonuclease H-like domain-containing protein [Tanacetum coccineum]|uniref:Ribonuclease H-like domain-containing protein n=1 Tax=Tanacetum coccineum TaxID=301880 RepID=A0ABQ4ZHG7_9ASTR